MVSLDPSAAAGFFLQIRLAEKNFRLISGLAKFLRSEQNPAATSDFCHIGLVEKSYRLISGLAQILFLKKKKNKIRPNQAKYIHPLTANLVGNELEMSPEILVYDVKLGDKYSWLAIHVGLTNNSMDLFDRVLESIIVCNFRRAIFLRRIFGGQNVAANLARLNFFGGHNFGSESGE